MSPAEELLVHLNYLLKIAQGYEKGALDVFSDNDSGPTFETLSALALELFVKVSLGVDVVLKSGKNVSVTLTEIGKTGIKFGHDLRGLFEADNDLCKAMDINVISTVSNKYIYKYEFLFKDGNKIAVRDFESIRYGTISQKPNVMYGELGNNSLIKDFLSKVDQYSTEKIKKAFKIKKD